MKITGTGNRVFLTVNGKRAGVTIAAGPWLGDVPNDMIKIRAKTYKGFPAEIGAALAIENNSDGMADYFEKDCIRIFPGHPLYESAKAASA